MKDQRQAPQATAFDRFVHLSGPLRLKFVVLIFTLTGLLGVGAELFGQEGAPAPKPAPARQARPPELVVSSLEQLPDVEDPVTLVAAGKHHLKAGDPQFAEAIFKAAVERMEIAHYADFAGGRPGEAVQLEWKGDVEGARAVWRAMIDADVLSAYFFIDKFSTDPDKPTLLSEARDRIDAVVKTVKEGGKAPILTTSSGKVRDLVAMSSEDAIAAFQKGEKLRYVYVDDLDLSKQSFTEPVQCTRCVVGSLETWGSTFKQRFGFQGIVMGNAHFGKKWAGEVNRSSATPAGEFDELFLDGSVVFGDVNLDSVHVSGRQLAMPLTLIEGELDARNITIQNTAEFRYLTARKGANFKGAELNGPTYFGNTTFGQFNFSRVVVRKNTVYFNSAHFTGPFTMDKCELVRGASFENARFDQAAEFRQSRIYARLNLSRARFADALTFSQIELQDLDFFGTVVHGAANFSDSVFQGNVRFALDGLTRRLHLHNVDPLHHLYKLYQGDDDAEEDLTFKSQYGVTHVDDLTARLEGDVSFANSIFQKFVNFEGVQFGSPEKDSLASFFNTQFYGEAHFERTMFYATADFRTIFGNELSFNQARFFRTWMLDDANVPGRLSMSGARLMDEATISLYGARIASFGITFDQLRDDEHDEHRLFYERCALSGDQIAPYTTDVRLFDARWDALNEVEITDPATITDNARRICAERTVGEFVGLRDSFSKRGMSQENEWAYWHLRHYKNALAQLRAPTFLHTLYAWAEIVIFEKGFGWGVRLSNLLGTGLVVVLVFLLLYRLMCGDMLIDWDGRPTRFRDLPLWGMFVVSFHSFLGRTRDWKATNSPSVWKLLYTTEIILGIILITFFIGAYTRLVLT